MEHAKLLEQWLRSKNFHPIGIKQTIDWYISERKLGHEVSDEQVLSKVNHINLNFLDVAEQQVLDKVGTTVEDVTKIAIEIKEIRQELNTVSELKEETDKQMADLRQLKEQMVQIKDEVDQAEIRILVEAQTIESIKKKLKRVIPTAFGSGVVVVILLEAIKWLLTVLL